MSAVMVQRSFRIGSYCGMGPSVTEGNKHVDAGLEVLEPVGGKCSCEDAAMLLACVWKISGIL